jgi:hypothetical protein
LRLHTQKHHDWLPILFPNNKIIVFFRLLGKDDAKNSSVFPAFVFYPFAATSPVNGGFL